MAALIPYLIELLINGLGKGGGGGGGGGGSPKAPPDPDEKHQKYWASKLAGMADDDLGGRGGGNGGGNYAPPRPAPYRAPFENITGPRK